MRNFREVKSRKKVIKKDKKIRKLETSEITVIKSPPHNQRKVLDTPNI